MNIPQTYKDKPLVHTWDYCAMDGTPFGAVGRYQKGNGKKDVVPFFKPNGTGWTMGIDINPRPLYGLDKLAGHPQDKAIFIVEGEKAAAAIHSLGVVAITSIGGSQAANRADWTPLSGYKTVYLLPDNDDPGEKYAQDVLRALTALQSPPTVKVLRLDTLPTGGDIVDWLQGWIGNWDGYQPIPENLHKDLKEKLKGELKNAAPPPDEWAFGGSVGANSSKFAWGKPNDIETQIPPVQVLPPGLIPEPYRLWLEDVSHRMQTPPDFAVISTIAITASIIGAGCGIRPKRLDDWEIIPNIWGACIGRPSVVLKSPSMKEPMQLLERLQSDYGKQFEKAKVEADFDSLANDAMLDDVKTKLKQTAKGKGKDGVVKGDDLQKLKADYLELTQNTEAEPIRRLFKTNETSIQSMTVLQNQNERGILVYRDEITGLLVKWDREDGAEERAYFLEGWNGNGSYTDVKIGRGVTDAKNICISLLGGIQPDKLKRYLYQAIQGNNDGLMQRLQLAVWPDEPKHWELIDTQPNKVEKDRAFSVMQTLAELDFNEYGAIKGEHGERPYFRFDEDGQAVFNQWLTELQTVKLNQEDNPLMVEHFGKFRSLMPSLALIFHR